MKGMAEEQVTPSTSPLQVVARHCRPVLYTLGLAGHAHLLTQPRPVPH